MASNMSRSLLTRNASPKDATVVLLGDKDVGKTSILRRFTRDEFKIGQAPTIGATHTFEGIEIENCIVSLSIWDTTGSERFESWALRYCNQAHAVILVYDITVARSFVKARSWFEKLMEQAQRNIIVFLVGNKLDLDVGMEHRAVSEEDGRLLAEAERLTFVEVSAKTGHGINDLFTSLAQALVKQRRDNDGNRSSGKCTLC